MYVSVAECSYTPNLTEPTLALHSLRTYGTFQAYFILFVSTLCRGPDTAEERENSACTPNHHLRKYLSHVTEVAADAKVCCPPPSVSSLLPELIWYSDEPDPVIHGIIYLHNVYSKLPSAIELAEYFRLIGMLFTPEFSESMMTWVNLQARDPHQLHWGSMAKYMFNLPKIVATNIVRLSLKTSARTDAINILEAIGRLISTPQVSTSHYGSSHPVNFTATNIRDFAARGGVRLK